MRIARLHSDATQGLDASAGMAASAAPLTRKAIVAGFIDPPTVPDVDQTPEVTA